MTMVCNGTVGGLVGKLELSSSSATLTNCFSCSYIDAKNATNAGGPFGNLKRCGYFALCYTDATSAQKVTYVFPEISVAEVKNNRRPTSVSH